MSDVGEGFARLQAAKERLQRCRDELNFAIEQVIDSQVELTALAPTTQGTDSGLDALIRRMRPVAASHSDEMTPEDLTLLEAWGPLEMARVIRALAEGAGK